jgi:hypothetical protein
VLKNKSISVDIISPCQRAFDVFLRRSHWADGQIVWPPLDGEFICSGPTLCAFLRLPNMKVTPESLKLIDCAWMAAISAHLRSDVSASNVDIFQESCITDFLEVVDEDR